MLLLRIPNVSELAVRLSKVDQDQMVMGYISGRAVSLRCICSRHLVTRCVVSLMEGGGVKRKPAGRGIYVIIGIGMEMSFLVDR
jgi:hypothetical protein